MIGAMIVAMLIGPIMGMSLSLVEGDYRLTRSTLVSLVGGVVLVYATTFVIGLLHRDIPITPEIVARTSPNLLDLMVAVAGSAARAYAAVSSRLSVSLVGVAVATALVPPLCFRILLGRGELGTALGAFELAFVNIVAIQAASAVVLWLVGFRGVTPSLMGVPPRVPGSKLLVCSFWFCWPASWGSISSRPYVSSSFDPARLR